MSSRPLIILGVIIIIFTVIAATGYVLNDQNPKQPVFQAEATTTPPATAPSFYGDASTPDASSGSSDEEPVSYDPPVSENGSSTLAFDLPLPGNDAAANGAATASWLIYADGQKGYSIEYPADLVEGATGGVFSASFPKNAYFHWPLLDDAKVTVSVSDSCPKVASSPTATQSMPAVDTGGPTQFALNGYSFTRTVGADVTPSGRDLEVAYDTKSNGLCFRLDFTDHGPNGAVTSVDDASLDAGYDSQHTADLREAFSIFNTIAGSFHILAST